MNRTPIAFVAFALASSLSTLGCFSTVERVGSHTLRSGPDTDQDVVWVTTRGDLHRCTAVQNKPTCTKVDVR